MVSKPADEGQAAATGDDMAVWSRRLRIPSQCRTHRRVVPLCSVSSSADSCRVSTGRLGTVRLLQRRAAASRRRSRCGRVIAAVPSSTSGPDGRRRSLHGPSDCRRPPAKSTCFTITADIITDTHVPRRPETSESRDIDDVIVQHDATVSTVQAGHPARLTSYLVDDLSHCLVLLYIDLRGSDTHVVYKEPFVVKLWCVPTCTCAI